MTLECCDVLVLRPEISVLSGAGVHHRMLKGGTNYSWTVMMKAVQNCMVDIVWTYAFLWNKPSH